MFLTSFILALIAVLIAVKLVILGISFLTSFILALVTVLVAKLVISGILPSLFFILSLDTFFLTTSIFTTSPSLLKSIGAGINLSKSNLSTLLSELFKLVGTFFS